MSDHAMSSTATPSRPRVRRLRGLWPAYYGVLFGNGWYAWFWGAMIVVYGGIAIGISLWGSTDVSLWETSTNSTKGTMTAMGIMSVPVFLPVMVAAGVTRRTFVVAATAALASLAAISSLLICLGFIIERRIYEAYAIPEAFSTNHLYTDASQLHLIFVESLLIQIAYAVSGMLVGLCFYRFGPIPGVLLILPSAIPAVGTEAVITGGTWFGPAAGVAFGAGWPIWLQVLVPSSAVVVAVMILHVVTVGTPLRPRKV